MNNLRYFDLDDNLMFDSPWNRGNNNNIHNNNSNKHDQVIHEHAQKIQQLTEDNRYLYELIQNLHSRQNQMKQEQDRQLVSGSSTTLNSNLLKELGDASISIRRELENVRRLTTTLNSDKLEKKIKKTVIGLYYPIYISLFLILLVFIMLIVHMSMRKTYKLPDTI